MNYFVMTNWLIKKTQGKFCFPLLRYIRASAFFVNKKLQKVKRA